MYKLWFLEKSKLDPNDPRNFKLTQLLDLTPKSSFYENVFFQIVKVERVQQYNIYEHLQLEKRFTMLCMRDQGVSFVCYK